MRPRLRYAVPAVALLLGGCALLAPATMPRDAEVADLPLIEVPAMDTVPGRPLVILLTGDGGWSGRVSELARELSERGISTVGWNSLRYYWHQRTPDGAARDLARILDHYRQKWRTGPVLLVGYSFGADVLPFLVDHLAPALRSGVTEVALVGFSPSASFVFHIPGWFGYQTGRTYPTHPEIGKLVAMNIPVLCVNGTMEDLRGCEGLSSEGVHVVLLPTGHSFAGHYAEIARLIVNEAANSSREGS